MPTYKFLKKIDFDAVGGPPLQIGDGEYARTPTRSGRFIIVSTGKHVSTGKYLYSTIAWGTPLREHNGIVQIKDKGVWKNLSSLEPFKKRKKEKLLTEKYFLDELKGMYSSLSGKDLLPSSWIFNDFGHTTIKYAKDNNENGVFDEGDTLMSDFIHTTPEDEYSTSVGENFDLVESHGCIHMKPNDIDIIKNCIEKYSVIEVMPYGLEYAPISFEREYGKPDYELHFYPSLKKIIVYTVTRIA